MPFETHKKTHVTFGESLKNEFGRKIYKLALDIGCTCPTRDGTLGDRGCIFCSAAGSGEFTQRYTGKEEELEEAKRRLGAKIDVSSAGFLPYFQNFTNTYAPVEYLEPTTVIPLSLKTCTVLLSPATPP